MNIKLSKKQWEYIGKQAGWMKKAQITLDSNSEDSGLTALDHNGIVSWAISKTDSNEAADALVSEITRALSQLEPEDQAEAIYIMKMDGKEALYERLFGKPFNTIS